MTAKKSFLMILRLVFILFSLQFVRDAFFKWDGYSYYMRFIEFLPDLSLSFILWTIPMVFVAFALWLIIYGVFKVIPKSLIPVRLEHIMGCFLIIVFLMFIKKTFFGHINVSGMVGLGRYVTLIVGGIVVVVVVWLGRKYTGKILYGLNTRITPLVWFFAILLILAVPFSMFTPLEKVFLTGFKTVNSQQSTQKRPNIILVTMDALTALDMQLYGYERPTTPFISEWAKDAVVFKRAYASSNWTTPGVMTLMSGQRAWTHRVWYRATFHPVNNYENNLPEILKDYGYAIYGFIQNNNASPETLGIKDAFLINDKAHTFSIPSGWWIDKLKRIFVNRVIVNRWIFETNPTITKLIDLINSYEPDISTTLQPAEMVYNRFLEYISQNPEKPFFAWLHVWPPHDVYLPPEPYMGMFGDAEQFNTYKKVFGHFNFDAEYKPEIQTDVDILRKRYDEFILYSDKQFELFLSRLREIIDMSNTIIILSSDHGESFSHGFLAHDGPHLYEPLVHIPLIVKIPGEINPVRKFGQSFLSNGVKGKVINMPVEQIDIAPTILELAAIRSPEWMEGQSLVPLLKGRKEILRPKGKSFEPRPIFSMQFIKNRVIGNPPITKGTIAVWEGDYKLIYYLEDDKKLLFNLNTDPGETRNIFKEEPEIGQRLMKLINDELDRANERITQAKGKS